MKKSSKYQLAWAAEQPIYKNVTQMERYIHHSDVVGNTVTEHVIYGSNGFGESYFRVDDVSGVLFEQGKKFLNTNFARKFVSDVDQTAGEYWNTVRKIRNSFSPALPDDKILKLYQLSHAIERKVFAHFVGSREEIMAPVEQRLADIVRNKYGDEYLNVYLLLITPTEADLLYHEKIDLLRLSDEPSEERIQAHALKYPLMLFNVYSEEEGVRTIKHRLEKNELSQIRSEIKRHAEEKEKIKNDQEKIHDELASPEAKELAWFIQQQGLGRLKLKACWGGLYFYLLPLFQHLARKAGVSARDFMTFTTPDDIVRLLNSGVWISDEELQARKRANFVHYTEGKIHFHSGYAAEQKKREILDSSMPSSDVSEIKGSIACRGKIRGNVMLVKVDTPSEIRKFAARATKNDILVTGMTNPNMTVLVNKVGGILTDEGGMACHAAIISREFKIPCLVGCKIATQVLKDGNIIELDADNGIVRKIQ